jgi:hypothetical protein
LGGYLSTIALIFDVNVSTHADSEARTLQHIFIQLGGQPAHPPSGLDDKFFAQEALSSRAADSRWRVQRGNDHALCTGKKRLSGPFKPCFGLSGIPLAQTDRSHCVIPTVAYPDFLLCVTNDVYVCGSLKRNKARFTPPAGRRRRWRLRRNKFSLHVWEGRKGHESPGAPSPRISCKGLLALANFMRLSLELSRVLPTHGT